STFTCPRSAGATRAGGLNASRLLVSDTLADVQRGFRTHAVRRGRATPDAREEEVRRSARRRGRARSRASGRGALRRRRGPERRSVLRAWSRERQRIRADLWEQV